MPFVILPSRIYPAIFFLLLAIVAITCIHRAEYFDEAWFAEQSFWFIHTGQVKSELFRGYNGWENGLYVFHKLFIYAGALVMSVTGISVATNKLVSLFFGLLCGYFIWLHGRSVLREQRWLSLLLYFGCGTLLRYICVNRPETMCMALGFASYIALDRPGRVRSKPALAGFLAGLSALTHLNGIIYLIAGAIWLFRKTDWRSTVLFIIVGGLTLSLYGLDAFLAGNLPKLVDQFRNDPATQQNFGLMAKLTVMVDYDQVFFHSPNETALSILVLLCAILFRKQIKLSEPVFLYTLILIVSFWILTKSSTDIYFLLFLPWLCILAAQWVINYLPHQPPWQRKLMRVILVGYAIVFSIQVRFVLLENKDAPDTDTHNALLASHMPQKYTKVIAPLDFFFGQVGNYTIRGLTYYLFLQEEIKNLPLQEFFRLAEKDNVAYIISDHRMNGSYDIPVSAPAIIGSYQRVFQDEWNTIYAHK